MEILEIMKVPYYKKGKVINKNKSQNVEIPVDNEETYFLGTLPEVEITASAFPETVRKGWEQQTNEWALQNPTAIFKPKYRKQRKVLTDDTWKAIIKANNITDPTDKRFKMIPTKFQEQTMQNNIREASNKVAKPLQVAFLAGTAIPVVSGLASGASAIDTYLTAKTPYYTVGKNILDNYFTYDGIKNALSDNGINKTINYVKDKQYLKAVKSGVGDILDVSGAIGFSKNKKLFSGLKDDFIYSKKFFKDKKGSTTTPEKIYNIARPGLKFASKFIKDFTNPFLYGIGKINDASMTGISGLKEKIRQVKSPKQLISVLKDNSKGGNNVYGTYFLNNTVWQPLNPSEFKQIDNKILQEIQPNGLSRYSNNPLYEMDLTKEQWLSDHTASIPSWRLDGTEVTNGQFLPVGGETDMAYPYLDLAPEDIGGHFTKITKSPNQDLEYDIEMLDNYHFTPQDYFKRYDYMHPDLKKHNLLNNIALSIFDIFGTDYSLYGKGKRYLKDIGLGMYNIYTKPIIYNHKKGGKINYLNLFK